jgi:hypothetical protein
VPKSGIGAELTIVTKTTSKTMEKIRFAKHQRQRAKGWRAPRYTVYVGRGSIGATLPDSFSEVPLGDSEMAAGAFVIFSRKRE